MQYNRERGEGHFLWTHTTASMGIGFQVSPSVSNYFLIIISFQVSQSAIIFPLKSASRSVSQPASNSFLTNIGFQVSQSII